MGLARRAWRARARLVLAVALAVALGGLLAWSVLAPPGPLPLPPRAPSLAQHAPRPRLARRVTPVLRQWEEWEQDAAESARSLASALGGAHALLVCDAPPYPPLVLGGPSGPAARLVSLQLELTAPARDRDPLSLVDTEYVLFVPDSSRAPPRRALRDLLLRADKNSSVAYALPFETPLVCQHIEWSEREWALKYEVLANSAACDGIRGKHALLIRTMLLRELPSPFMLPFPEALYLQTSARNIKIHIFPESRLSEGRPLLTAAAARGRAARLRRERRSALYRQIGVKKLTLDDGDVQWYGCTRDTERCFPAVQGVPSYIVAGRYTPPCCLRHLRRTARHVLRTLLMAGARCWLEATSLLGAVTRGDLLPWADRAEFGIHAADIPRVPWLERAQERGSTTDDDGYAWERATRGQYYRVAYSRVNRIYVNILPFQPKNGTMTKGGWFLEHQKEFSEHYLHPMGSVKFAGSKAPAPNNVREFLELKFGPNVIENTGKIGYKVMYP